MLREISLGPIKLLPPNCTYLHMYVCKITGKYSQELFPDLIIADSQVLQMLKHACCMVLFFLWQHPGFLAVVSITVVHLTLQSGAFNVVSIVWQASALIQHLIEQR